MSSVNLGKTIDRLAKLRRDKAKLDEKVGKIEAEIDEVKEEILSTLVDSGMEKASSKELTVSVRQSTVCTVKDWDAFYAFIKRNNHFHLLQKRVSHPAWREIYEMRQAKKQEVPGTEPFVKTDLGITTLKK